MQNLTRRAFIRLTTAGTTAFTLTNSINSIAQTGVFPNIVFIMADDLGYGEIQALNPERGKIATPNVDRLTKEGITFTDAHTGSSVCTPTRYGVLTGRYAWRTKLQNGVLSGNGPCLISSDTLTIAEMLKKRGYHTGIVGKWHLNWINKSDGTIKDGPLDHGFDYYYGYHHARDIKTIAENNKIIGEKPAVTMLPALEEKSIAYIKGHAKDASSGKPFFLYVPLNSPHSPVAPAPEWQGKSGLNAHADFVMQTDHTVGQIVKAIDEAGLKENTLIVFTADNGTSAPTSKKNDLEAKGHFPSGELRGSKSDIWDGGHRVPFIVRWPAKIKSGSRTDELICHTDFMPTAAEIIGTILPDNAAVDGFSYAKVLSGGKRDIDRAAVVHHSINGRFAIRNKQWKLVLCPGSGGWSSPKDNEASKQGLPEIQLYDMSTDIGEQKNVHAEHPEIVMTLTSILENFVAKGRSTPGPVQQNDISDIDIWKKGKGKKSGNKK